MIRTYSPLSVGRHGTAQTIASVAVLVGDVLVLLAFIGFGLLSHSIEPWEYPYHTLRTFTPFFIGWCLVAPLARVYRWSTVTSYVGTLGYVALAWIAASVLGAMIRSTSYFPGGAPIDFVLVNVGIGLLFFLPWRLSAAAALRRLFSG